MKNNKAKKILLVFLLGLLWLVALLSFIALWGSLKATIYWLTEPGSIWHLSENGSDSYTISVILPYLLISGLSATISALAYLYLTKAKKFWRRLGYSVPVVSAFFVLGYTIYTLGLYSPAQWQCPVTRKGDSSVYLSECCALFTTGCDGTLCKTGQNQKSLYSKTEYYCSSQNERENSKRETPIHYNLVSVCTQAPHCLRVKTQEELSCSTKMVDY